MKPIPYGKQEITEEDIAAVTEVLRSDFLTQGPTVKAFEEAFAAYVGAKHGVAVCNGTAALHLGLLALGTTAGSKVITTPITFAATANAILHCGAEVDFVDINPETFAMDLERVESKLETSPAGRYAGIIPVDMAGYPIDTESLRKIADKHDLWILEDACHAPGAGFTTQTGDFERCGAGCCVDAAIFSFHPVKHIACGEGGMVTTNNDLLRERIALLRSHGIVRGSGDCEERGGWFQRMVELGYNYRLSDIQAALGLSQLGRANDGLKKRRRIADRYNCAFAGIPEIKTPHVPAGVLHGYHLYIIQCDRRRELYDFLKERGIYAQVHYIPVHSHPFYQRKGWCEGNLPIAEEYYRRALSLPLYPSLKLEEQELVINTVMEFYGR